MERGAPALAVLVHIFTASGILCSLLAFQAVYDGRDFAAAFLWLGVAFFIDAVDGPMARRLQVKQHLPRFSGERLDLIIDYINYVLIPAFILLHSGLLSSFAALFSAGLMLVTALFHFADIHSKTEDNYFVGFPAVWNLVVFYFLAFAPGQVMVLTIVALLSLATFVPMKWVHPLRVRRLRPVTVLVCLLWSAAAIRTLYLGFETSAMERGVLLFCLAYLLLIGLWRTVHSSVQVS